MVKVRAINLGMAGRQDPLFGIDHANIATRLASGNWKEKAIVRIHQNGWLYLWIDKGDSTNDDGQTVSRYYVQVHPDGELEKEYKQDFEMLGEALAYANGEDEGKVANETRLAKSTEYPPSYSAPIVIGRILGSTRNL